MSSKVFLIGGTGLIGNSLLDELAGDHAAKRLDVSVAVHSPRSAEKVAARGFRPVPFDLNRWQDFDAALAGQERVFLLRPYTLKQMMMGKLVADSCKRVGVQHVVTLGAYGQPDTPYPVIAWNFLVEAYVERLGIACTHLQPNYFMDNVLVQRDPATHTLYNRITIPVSWIASADIAAVAAAVLRNPAPHAGKIYPLASEAASVTDIAQMMSEVTGVTHSVGVTPREKMMERLMAQGREPVYAEALVEYVDAVSAGEVPEIANIFDTVERVAGRPAIRFKDFLQQKLAPR